MNHTRKATRALAAFCSLTLLVSGRCQTYGPIGLAALQDPLPFVRQLANLPQQQQRLYLMLIGEGIKERQALSCNPFGGASECVTLPVTSSYADTCGRNEIEVDCIYNQEEAVDVTGSPAADLLSDMKNRGVEDLQDSCKACVNNIKRFHCLQTVPKCGSFQKTVETSLLPALVAVDDARDAGLSGMEALAAAVPVLLNRSALTMPCREMCEAIVSTCGCNKDYSFGRLLDAWSARQAQGSSGMASSFAAAMFSKIYTRPLCSVFASSTEPGFTGPCEALQSTCEDEAVWCNGDDGRNDGPMVVQELMAAQLATTLSGFTGNLFADQEEMVEDADSDRLASWEKTYLAPSGAPRTEAGHANVVLIIITVICGIAFAGAAAFAVYQHRKVRAVNHDNLNNGYISLNTVGRDSA
ncbi:g2099 [Coccomyxa viridis]|uniref:G2099 protein n=1 Tax=Coccomyxa viridis TaxID=1274662 RepID=A0ABP1FJL6_9CHLO